MKKLLIVFLGAIILFGCAEPECELTSDDLSGVDLKKAKVKNYFTGICSSLNEEEAGMVKLLPNGKTLVKGFYTVWHDDADDLEDWRVTGTTKWYVNQKIEEDGSFKYWGKAELIVDGERGTWDMTWHGYLTFTPLGPELIAYAVGQGKSGEVKGMVAKWTYTMDFANDVYIIEGYYK